MKRFTAYHYFIIITFLILTIFSSCKKEEKSPAISGDIQTGDFAGGDAIRVPLIAWGADLVTIYANGNMPKTIKGSIFHQEGLNVELFREDDFRKQTEMFIQGSLVYLRGTMGMINMASEKLSGNPKTRPVIIYQHSWSAGGDALVVKSGINSVSDLKGKTVAIQSYGPHVDYFMKLLTDARLRPSDVNIVWTKDLLGPKGDTPMAKLYQKNIDAAFAIIPDALALTSNGTVGTGAEDSVKGAKILLSTKTANRIIADIYAVRRDYFDRNREEVKKFVRALMKAEEEVRDLFKRKSGDQYSNLLSMGGKLLLDDPGATEDTKGMYFDAEMAGYNENVRFLSDTKYPRSCRKLTLEIQTSMMALGIISRRSPIDIANWNFDELKAGLKYATEVQISRFDPGKVQAIAEKLSTRKGSSLFSFEIFFQPNQSIFSANQYMTEFQRVIEMASTYGGAIITVEGHSDPMSYLRKEKEGAGQVMLKKIKQAAKNLSYSRASSVRDEIVKFAASRGITIDKNQFTVIGHGISSPKNTVPKTRDEWLKNMRVQFKIMQVEAEEEVFKPL